MHECIINQIIYISRICFKRKKLAFVSSKKKSWLSACTLKSVSYVYVRRLGAGGGEGGGGGTAVMKLVLSKTNY